MPNYIPPDVRRRRIGIRQLRGRPGQFYDAGSKQVFDISQAYEGDKYDTVELASGAQAAGTQYTFFNNLQNKRRVDTNFRTQNQLDANERMTLERVGVYFHMAVGNTLALAADVRKVVENAYVYLKVNDDTVAEGPCNVFPSGYGLVGQTTESDQTFATIGVAGTAAAAKLKRKQLLTDRHSLEGAIEFHARTWLTGYVNPSLANYCTVKLMLHGLINRPATR